jgi:spore maturation protein CgeB
VQHPRRLRIVYAAGTTPNAPGLPASRLWEANLHDSLLAMGHELIPVAASIDACFAAAEDPSTLARLRPGVTRAVLDTVERARAGGPIDLFFSYFYDGFVEPSAIEAIRRDGIVTVNFSCNDIHQFDLVRGIAPLYDACMVPEREALEDFRRAGARPIHVQMGANPAVYRPYDVPRDADVSFVGQRYADRADLVLHLARNGVGVRAWGPGWAPGKGVPRLRRRVGLFLDRLGLSRGSSEERTLRAVSGPPLRDEDLVRLYSRSKISLGFGVVGDTHLGAPRFQVRLRDFEAPMSGACYLTQHVDELAEYYRIGEEIDTFRDRDELLDKARFYLERPERAEALRRAGRKRALRDHTWQARFGKLFRELGLLGGS